MATLICTSIPVDSAPCSWVQIDNSWSTGFKAVVNIQMEMSVDHWSVGIEFTHTVLKLEAWKGLVTKISDKKFTINNSCYNNMVYSCQCFQLPFLVRHQPGWTGNITVSFNGQMSLSCTSDPCVEEAITGISPSEAIATIRATVQDISDGLHDLTNTSYKRGADNFSDDEKKLLKRLTNVTMYLQNECINKTGKCESTSIEVFRNELISSFNIINDTGKISPGFLQEFEVSKKTFDEVCAIAIKALIIAITTTTATTTTTTTITTGTTTTSSSKAPPVCPSKSSFLEPKQAGVLNEFIQQRMVQGATRTTTTTTVCSTPPTKNNGQWWCSGNNNSCYLKCNPDYASLFTSTSCVSGVWTNLDKMQCDPSVFLLIVTENVDGNAALEIYHPRIEKVTCTNYPPTLDKKWPAYNAFLHNGLVYVWGGSDVTKFKTRELHELFASLNITNQSEQWRTHNISFNRVHNSAVVMQNKIYLIGKSSLWTMLPLEKESLFLPVPNLPVQPDGLCIVKITEDSFVITGSWNVTKYNVTGKTSSMLPKPLQERWNHGCVMVEEDGKQWIVVAGGENHSGEDVTTERFDLNGGTQWESLGQLNVPKRFHRTSVTENGIIAIGGYWDHTVEILHWATQQWKLLESSLMDGKLLIDTVEIPASTFNCDIYKETVCSSPPTKTKGQWWCSANNNSCYLKCDPGYASLFTSTSCIGGAWTDLDKMECEPSVFLLIGGETDGSYSVDATVDIYHPSTKNITCANHPPQLDEEWLHSATFVHNGVIYVCGGSKTKDLCASLNMTDQSGEWKSHNISSVGSAYHSAVVMQDNLYFIGGIYDDDNVWTSLPLDNEPTFTAVPNMLYRNHGQCVVKISEDSFVVIGGENSTNVTQYNVKTQTSTELPSLPEERIDPGCLMVEEGGKQWIVVAGGWSGSTVATTERLDINDGTQWQSLGQLNVPREEFRMGEMEIGIIVMGGYNNDDGLLDTVELLNWTTKQWKLVEPNLKVEREGFDKVEVPASIFNCRLCPFIIFEAGNTLCQIWDLLEVINNFITIQVQTNRQKRLLSTAENNLIGAMINITSETLNCCTNDAACNEGALKLNHHTMNESFFEIKSFTIVSPDLINQWDTEYSNFNSAPTKCKSVSCGDHLAIECFKCPQGKGANWCHGDCAWINETCIPVKQCIPDSHVYEQCKCVEELCPLEGICRRKGYCDIPKSDCVPRKLNGNNRKIRDTSEGEMEFKMVPVEEAGKMANVSEVLSNIDKVKNLLEDCDIAKLEDGLIEGMFYGGNDINITNEECKSCNHKIIKNDKGVPFCSAEKHVDRTCQCGGGLCEIGDSCIKIQSITKCNKNTDCPVGYKHEWNKREKRSKKGKQKYQMVHINSTLEPMATTAELKVEENLKMVLELMEKCDIVKVVGGTVEGKGYGSTVQEKSCDDCQYKIIRKYDPPKEEYNMNVADKCCFIIRSCLVDGTNQTFVLTNHSLLETFPGENCSEGCMYTLFEDLDFKNSPQFCLNEIKNYTCCSQNTGSFCEKYGQGSEKNIQQGGTCSTACTEIANCSSGRTNPNDHWCTPLRYSVENSNETIVETSTTALSTSTENTLVTTESPTSEEDSNSTISAPEYCTPIVDEPVEQTALYYPLALPSPPFTLTRSNQTLGKKRVKRSSRLCSHWAFWAFTCNQAYNYPTYFFTKSWYRRIEKFHFFKHECCKILQPQCSKTYSCPKINHGSPCTFDKQKPVGNTYQKITINGITSWKYCSAECQKRGYCTAWALKKDENKCIIWKKFNKVYIKDNFIWGARFCTN